MSKTDNQPDFIAYVVKEKENRPKPVWVRIGAAWLHKDGKGVDIQLDAPPHDGRMTLREPFDPHATS